MNLRPAYTRTVNTPAVQTQTIYEIWFEKLEIDMKTRHEPVMNRHEPSWCNIDWALIEHWQILTDWAQIWALTGHWQAVVELHEWQDKTQKLSQIDSLKTQKEALRSFIWQRLWKDASIIKSSSCQINIQMMIPMVGNEYMTYKWIRRMNAWLLNSWLMNVRLMNAWLMNAWYMPKQSKWTQDLRASLGAYIGPSYVATYRGP